MEQLILGRLGDKKLRFFAQIHTITMRIKLQKTAEY
jgi:hypothetical protein